jgi:starvation-inducible DNA-binding protein
MPASNPAKADKHASKQAAQPATTGGMDIGISDKDRAAIANGLSHLLADTYTLYLTTHNFHWNVTGPMFNSLHAMFMTQYTELWTAVDPIAERIRSLGHVAPGSYAQFGELSSLPDAPAKPPKALEMVRILAEGQRRTHHRPARPAPHRSRASRLDVACHAGGVTGCCRDRLASTA